MRCSRSSGRCASARAGTSDRRPARAQLWAPAPGPRARRWIRAFPAPPDSLPMPLVACSAMDDEGRVAGIWRYPVKSMAAEPLDHADVSWHGLAGDRRWAFVRAGLERSNFPWLTIRERSDMGHYRPSFADPSRVETSDTVVGTPAAAALDVTDPALAAELAPGARLIKQKRGVFDTAPL